MPAKLNPLFNNKGSGLGNRNERNLVQGLVDESIQRHGFSMTYIMREEDDLSAAWQEDITPDFKKSFTIECFLRSYDGFEGGGVLNTKYSFSIDQMAKILVSRTRWDEEYLTDPMNIPELPREGDMVLLSFGADDPSNYKTECEKDPFGDHKERNQGKLFEVMYVDNEPDKWQLRGHFFYEITLRLADYQQEEITFVDEDSKEENFLFNEETDMKKLSTENKNTIFANKNPETGKEVGNVEDVVKEAQNRELEIRANEVSKDRRVPSTNTSDDQKDLLCDNTLDTDGDGDIDSDDFISEDFGSSETSENESDSHQEGLPCSLKSDTNGNEEDFLLPPEW